MLTNVAEKPTIQHELQDYDSEQRFSLNGVTWQQYEAFLEIISDNFPNLRITYLEGTLQLMSPSRRHEIRKKLIGSLLEAYLQETRTCYYPLGSTTFRKQAKARGIEPDECYCIGTDKPFPDIAIEVVISSGGIDSLEVYKGLEVPEVWFWQNNEFQLYHLNGTVYEQINHSQFLPNLDLNLLATYVVQIEPFDAIMEYREIIRQQSQK